MNFARRIFSYLAFFFMLPSQGSGVSVTGNSATGFYIGGSGNFSKMKVDPDFPGKPALKDGMKECEKRRFTGALVTGYTYSFARWAIASQLHFGISGAGIPSPKSWTYEKKGEGENAATEKYKMESDFYFRNRYNFGADILGGFSFSSFLIYGLVGLQMRVFQTRGSLSATLDTSSATVAAAQADAKKAVVYFGKKETTLQGTSFSKLKPSNKFVPFLVVGGGLRFFIARFFIGAEFRYDIPRTRTMKVKYALVDKNDILGFGKGENSSGSKEKTEIKSKIKNYGGSLLIGLKL